MTRHTRHASPGRGTTPRALALAPSCSHGTGRGDAGDTTIRTATARDLPYILALTRRFTDALGFIPAEGIAAYIERGAVTLALENGDPAGFLLAKDNLTPLPSVRPILQAAVQLDAQRNSHGRRLVRQVEQDARAAGRRALRLWCREELEANAFWRAAGFTRIGTRPAGGSRKGNVIMWGKMLRPLRLADLLLARPERHRGPGGTFSTKALDITPAAAFEDLAAAA